MLRLYEYRIKIENILIIRISTNTSAVLTDFDGMFNYNSGMISLR